MLLQDESFSRLLTFNSRFLPRKTVMFCPISKSHVLCFRLLLSFVPTIFIFFANSLLPCSPETSALPSCRPVLSARAGQIAYLGQLE